MTASLDLAAANALMLFAQAEEGQSGTHVNPYLTGIGSFVLLVLCLAVTLVFNRDR